MLEAATAALRKMRAGRRDAFGAWRDDFDRCEVLLFCVRIGDFYKDAFAGQSAIDEKSFAVVMGYAVALRAKVGDGQFKRRLQACRRGIAEEVRAVPSAVRRACAFSGR